MDHTGILHVSTRDAISHTGDKFKLAFGANNLQIKNIVAAYPVRVCVPNVFNNVIAPYNTLIVGDSDSAPVEITIPEGRYTGGELATAINTQIAALGPAYTGLTITYAPVAGQSKVSKFTWNSTRTLLAFHTVTSGEESLGMVIGYRAGEDPYAQYQVTSTAPITLELPNLTAHIRQIHILSEKLGHMNLTHTSAPYSQKDIVVSIPLTVTYGGYQIWERGSDTKSYESTHLDSVNLDTVEFALVDQDFRPISLPRNYHLEMTWHIEHGDGK